ncbi:MAG: amino acid racemase [Clostridiales bacterium]|nr:amino acid racemase [Clostridiales bacterium]
MRKIGLVGGTGPESTVMYYKKLNEEIDRLTDSQAMPDISIESVDFRRAWDYVTKDEKGKLADYLLEKIRHLYRSGAQVVALTAVTMHMVYDDLAARSPIELISIPKAVSEEVASRGIKCIGLLGTAFTMEQDFMKKDLEAAGISVIVPDETDRALVAKRILEELERGIVKEETLAELQSIIKKMKDQHGIEGVILGCTELPLILNEKNCPVPCFDAVEIHLKKLVALALEEDSASAPAANAVSTDPEALAPCGSQDIDTGRLLLRKFRYDDADSMLKNWVSDEAVQDMYAEPTYKTHEELKPLLDKYIGGYDSPYYYRWAVIEKSSSECIGQVAFFLVDQKNHYGEIEYCIGRAYQGKGYATEATKALIRYGFETIHFHKIQICVRPSNQPSKKVIDKCGFILNGVLPDYFYRHGSYEDRMYFSLFEKDLPEDFYAADDDPAIARVRKMEQLFDQARDKIARAEKSKEEFLAFQPQIEKLASYYESSDWKEDFARDEEGGFPKTLKRGVLSEDGIYNLLERNTELLSGD